MYTKTQPNLVNMIKTGIMSAGIILSGVAPVAHAAIAAPTPPACQFINAGKLMILQKDCSTSTTILIPDGFTLVGNGHTITAINPAADHFRGAIVKNSGKTANVTGLTLTTKNLSDVCDEGDDRLRGIYFINASGSISGNTVNEINQGSSGCQEGNAIEARATNFDTIILSEPMTVPSVKITSNRINHYQKTGILATGYINVDINTNTITGLGPINYIAQNGIQASFGASGQIINNTISANSYTPATVTSTGMLIYAPGNIKQILGNKINTSDIGMYLSGINGSTVSGNTTNQNIFDGIALTNDIGTPTNNQVSGNTSSGNGLGISVYDGTNNTISGNTITGNLGNGIEINSGMVESEYGSEYNTVKNNTVTRNGNNGIAIDGEDNTITGNTAVQNHNIDITNYGDNSYANNTCNTSSGYPVDCPNNQPSKEARQLAPTQNTQTILKKPAVIQ